MNNTRPTTKNQLPTIEIPTFDHIPKDLSHYNQWVTYEYVVEHIFNSTGSLTWHSTMRNLDLDTAYKACFDHDYGLAFELTDDDPFVLITTRQLIEKLDTPPEHAYFDSYAEMAPSMEGGHLVNVNTIIAISNKSKYQNFSHGRHTVLFRDAAVPITGNCISRNTKIVENRTEEFRFFLLDQIDLPLLEFADLVFGHIERKDALYQTLIRLLSLDAWAEIPEDRELYPFLAACWPLPNCRERILARIQGDMWSRNRREAFIDTIQSYLPAKPRKSIAGNPDASDGDPDNWEELLQWDSRGKKVVENFYNMDIILKNHDTWKSRLRWDLFRACATLDGKPVSDELEFRIAEWLGQNYKMGGNHHKSLARAIVAASMLDKYDSLLEWVDGLPEWDGTERLRTWMIDWCGAEDSEYSAWVGWVTMLQMMARALNPGSLARLVPIWEGPENRGKSTAIAVIGGEWATTFKISMDSKEAHMAIQGFLVAELEELDTMYRTTESRLKAFISNTHDHFIPKYSNHAVTYPRRTVFIGTTNDEKYLKSSTGNTRFLPIRVDSFDLDAIREYRLQLFAEAKQVLSDDPAIPWWQEPEQISEVIAEARESRREENVFEDSLRCWLDGESPYVSETYKNETTWNDIATNFLKIDTPQGWKDKSLQAQTTQALKSLNWKRVNRGGKTYWQRSGYVHGVPF